MRETCCQFGEEKHLAGVITEPGLGAPRGALLLINAGLAPKAGPFRLYTELARRLAQEGWMTLRFDLGGIGDSDLTDTQLPLKSRTHQEIEAALEYIYMHYRPDEIVLGGLCSGAEDSFSHAELDPRVTGVLMIDPFAYRTAGWRWRNLLVEGAKRVLGAAGFYRHEPQSSAPAAEQLATYKYIEQAVSRRILQTLVQRNARLHFVYTGGMSAWFNHPQQLREMFAGISLGPSVTVDHLPRLGHTQLLAADRELLIESIARRLAV